MITHTEFLNTSDEDAFSDVLVKPLDDKLFVKVHVKPINAGECLKDNSEWSDKYKLSFIKK